MSDDRKRHNILVASEYESGGEKKTQWVNAVVAFKNKGGDGFNCEVVSGLALTGRFMILPRTNKAENDGTQGDE